MSSEKLNILKQLISESSAYTRFEDIEKLVENDSLAMVPVHPLYVSLLSASSDEVAKIVPKLSVEQQQAMVDLDLWEKDRVDVSAFEYWIEVYSKVEDTAFTSDFVQSANFLLYLKSRVNIYTFDTEEPEYPEHDNYFLTDDMLLLIEFDESYKYVNELKYLIRNIYDTLGVENAYSLLFKLINDSFSQLEESEYVASKERLKEYGFVDFYEAREKTREFVSVNALDKFIHSYQAITPSIDIYSRIQNLHASALTSFSKDVLSIEQELNLVRDEKRAEFLNFSFLRLINSMIAVNQALREGSVELSRIGLETKKVLNIGIDKIRHELGLPADDSVFKYFDFFDVYRVGSSLFSLTQKMIINALRKTTSNKEGFLHFLGGHWGEFLEHAKLGIPKVRKKKDSGLWTEIKSYNEYLEWKIQVEFFIELIPYMDTFHRNFEQLKSSAKIHGDFYLNHEVDEITIESVLLTSIIRLDAGDEDSTGFGLKVSELKLFISKYFQKIDNEHKIDETSTNLTDLISSFTHRFELDNLERLNNYLLALFVEHLSGYDFESLSDEDFKHVGGPVLLNYDVS